MPKFYDKTPKAAVLTGLSMIVGAASVSEVEAASINATLASDSTTTTFQFIVDASCETSSQDCSAYDSDEFTINPFDTSLGTLTDVQLVLQTQSYSGVFDGEPAGDFGAWLEVEFDQIVTMPGDSQNGTGTYDLDAVVPQSTFTNSSYSALIGAVLEIEEDEDDPGSGVWGGVYWAGSFQIVYEYNPVEDLAPVPLPASLPLLFGGLTGLAVLSRRRRDQTHRS